MRPEAESIEKVFQGDQKGRCAEEENRDDKEQDENGHKRST